MKNIVITVSAKTSDIKTSSPILAIKGEHLQTQAVVEFSDEFVDGTATLEYKKKSGTKGSLPLTKNGEVYTASVTSAVTDEAPEIKCQVKVVQATTAQGTPIFKSKTFQMKICDCIDE